MLGSCYWTGTDGIRKVQYIIIIKWKDSTVGRDQGRK